MIFLLLMNWVVLVLISIQLSDLTKTARHMQQSLIGIEMHTRSGARR